MLIKSIRIIFLVLKASKGFFTMQMTVIFSNCFCTNNQNSLIHSSYIGDTLYAAAS